MQSKQNVQKTLLQRRRREIDKIDNWKIYKSYLYIEKPKISEYTSCELLKSAAHINIARQKTTLILCNLLFADKKEEKTLW